MTKSDIRKQYVSNPATTGNVPRDLRTRAKRSPLPKSSARDLKKLQISPAEFKQIEDLLKTQKVKMTVNSRGMHEQDYLKAQDLARKYGVTWPKWGTKGDMTGYLGDVIRICAQTGTLAGDDGYYVAKSLKFLTPANVNPKALSRFMYWMNESWTYFLDGMYNNADMARFMIDM